MTEVLQDPGIVFIDHGKYLQVRNPLFDEVILDPSSDTPKAVLANIVGTPIGQRGLDLTQLSKDQDHETIRGTHNFYRTGHNIVVGEATDRIARREKATPRQRLAYVLAASLPDFGHGPLSHATDIAVEGPGQKERFHELRVAEALALGGVMDVLKERNIRTKRDGTMKGVAIPPWVECDAPGICVDRLQYTLQEMLLWFWDSQAPEAQEIIGMLTEIATLKTIDINEDGNMVFTNVDHARLFAKGYLLLSTEHWNDPVNRVQLYLLIEALKYSIVNRRLPHMTELDHGVTRKPFDYLYAVDSDVIAAMQPHPGDTDPYLFAIANQLAGVGYEERNRFRNFKRPIFETFLRDDLAVEYPSALLHGNLADFGPPSSQFETHLYAGSRDIPAGVNPQVPHLVEENGVLHYLLSPLKNRFVNPLVRTSKGDIPLGDYDPRYQVLLEQHQRIQRSTLSVHIPTTSTYRELLWEQAQKTSAEFFEAQKKSPKMNKDPKRRGIQAAGQRALAVATARGSYVTAA